jgi:hypothetical protein
MQAGGGFYAPKFFRNKFSGRGLTLGWFQTKVFRLMAYIA